MLLAAGLDYLVGDPWNWLHPVQVMGWGIRHYTDFVLKRWDEPITQRIAGIGLTIGLMSLSGWLGWLLIWLANSVHPWLGVAVASIILASCFAGRSLRHAAEEVLTPLQQGDLETARSTLSRYVGRDTDDLSEAEILRAVLETVTENAVDGVIAPLFWAIVGAFTPWGSVPFALAYKAASTLDSMVGYREAPYTNLGWCSAKLEDLLTWIPCRLSVFSLALLSGKPLHVWRLCHRDAPQDPSPNAGWSECAYAATLGVQVGGINRYQGVVKHKPLLGEPFRPIAPGVIRQAMGLTRLNLLIGLAIGVILLCL
ncbi:cobalamin biosynthesis protein [filamentous cyanobacterium CCP2]|nr:cobalamin biosynthesis protein [filamentous cyanobacterium CCP2]